MYQKIITYKRVNNEELTIRELLKKWLIPKKWQHFFRIQQDVLINGQYHSFNTIVQNGDVITLNFNFPPRTEQHYLPGNDPIEVVYEDDDIIVVNKSAGKKTHPNLATESDSLMNDVESYLQNGHPYMVHRIDMETSGLVLISKTPYLVPIFNRQLSSKTLHREYLALVNLDSPIDDSGTIDQPIDQDPTDVRKRMVAATGLSATTKYQVDSRLRLFRPYPDPPFPECPGGRPRGPSIKFRSRTQKGNSSRIHRTSKYRTTSRCQSHRGSRRRGRRSYDTTIIGAI